ncbi:hypothetical protein [uncultured Nostoc sp.]|uniref:hypothetical protein n=1 Tax=uncultured Nostoc sp. TaxID=340711 RepID=UPI0026069C69|nr:hypothetical protein [uncultured Nostoc sp.]
MQTTPVRWTTADLELFAGDSRSETGFRNIGFAIIIQKKVEVYRREQAALKLAVTLFSQDELTSPLLPGFNCLVSKLF